jgi:hypothetical protein
MQACPHPVLQAAQLLLVLLRDTRRSHLLCKPESSLRHRLDIRRRLPRRPLPRHAIAMLLNLPLHPRRELHFHSSLARQALWLTMKRSLIVLKSNQNNDVPPWNSQLSFLLSTYNRTRLALLSIPPFSRLKPRTFRKLSTSVPACIKCRSSRCRLLGTSMLLRIMLTNFPNASPLLPTFLRRLCSQQLIRHSFLRAGQ